jgi:Protein of unknown function (DUF1118)
VCARGAPRSGALQADPTRAQGGAAHAEAPEPHRGAAPAEQGGGGWPAQPGCAHPRQRGQLLITALRQRQRRRTRARALTRVAAIPPCARPAAEKAGFTLSNIEALGLLSKAESLGALSLATDRNTPGALTTAGLALVAGAAGVGYLAAGADDTTLLVAEAAGAALLGGAGLAALVAGNVLGSLQKA